MVLAMAFPDSLWTWCIRSSSTHRGPWPNHGFPCAWDEQQCWGHDLRHAFPSPALSSLWDFRYLMSPFTIKNLLIFCVSCAPPAASPCHQGHGQAVTFPMAVEGHGLACSSHGFPRLGCTACTLLLCEVGRIENADLLCFCSLVWSVLLPPFQLGVYRISFSHWYYCIKGVDSWLPYSFSCLMSRHRPFCNAPIKQIMWQMQSWRWLVS